MNMTNQINSKIDPIYIEILNPVLGTDFFMFPSEQNYHIFAFNLFNENNPETQNILNNFKETLLAYYKNIEGAKNASTTFENLLQKANQYLINELEPQQPEFLKPNGILGMILNDQIYISRNGDLTPLILTKKNNNYQWFNILKHTTGLNYIQNNTRGLFSQIICGPISVTDWLVLTNLDYEDHYQMSQIKNIILEHPTENIQSALTKILNTETDPKNALIIINQNIPVKLPSDQIIPNKQSISDTQKNKILQNIMGIDTKDAVDTQEEYEENTDVDETLPDDQPQTTPVMSTIKTKLQGLTKPKEKIKQSLFKTCNTIKLSSQNLTHQTYNLLSILPKKRILIIIAIVIMGTIGIYSIILNVQNQKQLSYEKLITTINNKLIMAQQKIILRENLGAKIILAEAQKLIQQLPKSNQREQQNFVELQNKSLDLVLKNQNVVVIKDPKIITNKSKITSKTINLNDFKPSLTQPATDIVTYNDNVYVLLATEGKIMKYKTLQSKYVSPTSLPINKTHLYNTNSMAIDGNIYILKNTGEILKFYKGKQMAFTIKNLEDKLTNPIKIKTNSDVKHIYLLDAKSKRIVVLNKNGTLKTQIYSDKFDNLKDLFIENNTKVFVLNDSTLYEVNIP